MHRHITKAENIINRAGAEPAVQTFESDANGELDECCDVCITSDGLQKTLKAGDTLVL